MRGGNIAEGSISLKSKIKTWCLNGLIINLFVLILGLCSLPTIFYFTAEKLEPSNSSMASNMSSNGKFSHLNYPQNILICNKPLIEYKKNNSIICVPPCGWKPWNEKEKLEINGTTYTACFLSLFSFMLALLTWFKIPRLWRYPHFIIVIMLGQSTLIVSIVSVATLLESDVFCSSKFLIPGMKTTTFCKFQGAFLHYMEGSISLWFVAYNFVVAKGLVFDKAVHAAKNQNRWYFLISALACWLIPILPVIIVLLSEEGYSVSFYSNFCFPSSLELAYYSAILPENVLFAIGVSFLYIVIWKLLKERRSPVTASQEQARLRKNKMNNVVTRLTLLMVFYAVTIYLTYGGICYLMNKAKAFETAIKAYFSCLMIRPTCSPDYKQFISHVPIVLNYIAAGIFPVSTMLFLAANEKARELWKKPYYGLRGLMSHSHEQSPNTIARNTSVTHLLNEDNQLFGHA